MIDFDHCVLHLSPRIVMGSYWPDLSRYKNNGRIYGAELRHGMLWFSGNLSYVDCGDDKSLMLDTNREYTVIVGIMTSHSGEQQMVVRHSGENMFRFALSKTGKLIVVWYGDDGQWHSLRAGTTLINDGNYHLVGWRIKENKVTGLVDGKEERTNTLVSPASNCDGKVEIARGKGSTPSFIGYIGELLIYNIALSTEKFRILYELTSPYGTH